MANIIRNVRDLGTPDRRALEQVIGHPLREDQQVVIEVKTLIEGALQLPDYFNVYDGLSDEEVAELEELILDRSPSRSDS